MGRTFVRAESDYLEVESSPLTGPGPILLEAWYKPSSIANGTVLGLGDSSANRVMAIGMNATGNAFAEAGGMTTFGLSAGGTLEVDKWAHLFGAFISQTERLVYLNGVAGTTNTADVGTVSGQNRVTVGALVVNGSRVSYAGGNIARCRVFDGTGMTAGDIASLAAALAAGGRPIAPAGEWLITGTDSPELDTSGGGRHLTVGGADNASDNPPASSSPPVNTAAPTVSGTAQVGQTLTVTNGSWDNSPTGYTYQWQRLG